MFPVFAANKARTDRQLGYDAVDERGRRRPIVVESRREEEILDQNRRSKLNSGSRDLRRNFEVAAWMIRKHLDFVSRFRFQSRTPDKGFNKELEAFVELVSKRSAFEITGRHSRERAVRMMEAHRTVDGDILAVKLNDGRVQLVEGDRIRDPMGAVPVQNGTRWAGGVRLNAQDAAVSYGVHRRKIGGGFEWEREVAARNAWLHGYFDRIDQCRGVSPFSASLARLTHVYEGLEYAHAKAKVQQLLGLLFLREYSPGDVGAIGTTTATSADGEEASDDDTDAPRYKVDLGRGIWSLEMEPGDKAEVLETKHPSNEFQSYTTLAMAIALKSLDIPFSFFDESHTNFHGSLRALHLYIRSAKSKQEDNQELQSEWVEWRVAVAIRSGDLQLPSGWTIDDLQCQFIPDGIPWWDKAKELRGDLIAIGAGLDNPQRSCLERGVDFEENIDRIAEALAYAREKLEVPFGMRLSFDAPPPEPVTVETTEQ